MIIDNCLPLSLIKEIVSVSTNWPEMPWYFAEHTAYESNTLNDLSQGSRSTWAHNVVLEGKDNSFLSSACKKAFNIILKKSKLKSSSLIRIRIGLITASPTTIVHDAHIDFYNVEHTNCLIYLNECDGDTILYKKFHTRDSFFPQKCLNEDIDKTISPKFNRAVIFNGWQYHSSSSPTTKNYRLVMTINFTTNK